MDGPTPDDDPAVHLGAAGLPASRSQQHIGVALSGGGHRASLFGLGALLYLVDAGKGPGLAAISSISGGSLTNGYVGLNSDVTTIDKHEFRKRMQPFAARLATGGTLWASWQTMLYLAVLAVVAVGGIATAVVISSWWSLLILIITIIIVGALAQQRSRLVARVFDQVLFHGAALHQLAHSVDHVVCATDLQTAEHVYFSGTFVNSYRLGWGQPVTLRVAQAVQASAALPGAFNPVTLPTAPHGFPTPVAWKHMLLSDGGVYDNMGTEWPLGLARRIRGAPGAAGVHGPIDELLVINASAGKQPTKQPGLRVPVLGELRTLLAVTDTLYDQTTAVRRRFLDLRYRLATQHLSLASEPALGGVMVQIDRSPHALPAAFANGDDAYSQRARAALAALGETATEWAAIAETNRAVKTNLSAIGIDASARLLRHAYVLTMVNAHTVLNYPLYDIPDLDSFREMISAGKGKP
jgi:Patatin-like phospholipase